MRALIFNTHDYLPQIFGKSFGFFVAEAARRGGAEDAIEISSAQEQSAGAVLLLPSNIPLVSPDTIAAFILNHHNGASGGVTVFVRNGVAVAAAMEPDAYASALSATSVEQCVAFAVKSGFTVLELDFSHRLFTVENPSQLAVALAAFKAETNERYMEAGVTIIDPSAVYIAPYVSVGCGTILYPGTTLDYGTSIGENCSIGPNSHIINSRVGHGSSVANSVVQDSEIGSQTNVGPFAYIRPNSKVGDHCKVGDFVEVKNSVIGNHSKASHLTYIGDCDVGQHVNFGCGTVIVNYDGKNKSRSTIKDGAFIGCNSNIVSPVVVNEKAYTAAGSTITHDVPERALGIARSKQVNKEGWNRS